MRDHFPRRSASTGRSGCGAIAALPALAEGAHDVPRAWLGLLAAEADARNVEDTALPFESAAEVLAIPNGEPLARMLPGVERRLAEALERLPPSLTQTRVTASAAMFASLAGDPASAGVLWRGSAAADSFEPLSHAEVAAVTALPADTRPAEQLVPRARGEFLHGLLDFVEDHDARQILRAMVRTPPPDEDEKQAWSLAAAGDGEGLVRPLACAALAPSRVPSLRLGTSQLRTGPRRGPPLDPLGIPPALGLSPDRGGRPPTSPAWQHAAECDRTEPRPRGFSANGRRASARPSCDARPRCRWP